MVKPNVWSIGSNLKGSSRSSQQASCSFAGRTSCESHPRYLCSSSSTRKMTKKQAKNRCQRSQLVRASRVETNLSISGSDGAIPKLPYELDDGVEQGLWNWTERNCKIRYQKAGTTGPAVLLIHGKGGGIEW